MAVSVVVVVVVVAMVVVVVAEGAGTTSTSTRWCVARSNVSEQELQTALDYACGGGADCAPIQSTGLCYLPNTLQAHASYAFDSFFQRKAMSPGSCDFSGTATVAMSDPSYGSCVYPSSQSTAGGATTPGGTTPTTPITTPNAPMVPTTTTPIYGAGGGTGGLTPGLGPALPNTDNSNAYLESSITTLLLFSFFLFLSFVFQPI